MTNDDDDEWNTANTVLQTWVAITAKIWNVYGLFGDSVANI